MMYRHLCAVGDTAIRILARSCEASSANNLDCPLHIATMGSKGKQKTISSNRADWAHRGFMQMITVVTGIRSMPVMRIV